MINRILKRLEEESFWAESTFDEDGYLCDDGIQVVNLQTAKEIVQEVAKEYDEFDVIYKKVCELEKEYDESADNENVSRCIRLENLMQYFKGELKAPHQNGRKLNRCDTCTYYVADEVPPICYFCCKGMEDNYEQKGE